MIVNRLRMMLPMGMQELRVLRRRGTCCAVEAALTEAAAEEAAAHLRLLADPTRLSMLATLRAAREPVCVCDFVASYELSQPTISHHMGKLRAAGLVEAHKEGVWTYYSAVQQLPTLVETVLGAVSAERPIPSPAR